MPTPLKEILHMSLLGRIMCLVQCTCLKDGRLLQPKLFAVVPALRRLPNICGMEVGEL
jgi:hypothetical protein